MSKQDDKKHLIGCTVQCDQTGKVGKVISYNRMDDSLTIETGKGERIKVFECKIVKVK